MKTQDKNTIIGAVVLIAIILIGYGLIRKNDKSDQEQVTTQPDTTTGAGTETPTPEPAAGSGKLSYSEAVKTYAYRFQFTGCHGYPGFLSVKKGSPVMLDNRDNKAHTIKVSGQTFKIAAYGYAVVYPQIVTAETADLTKSNITCDGGGAATLNVEK